MIEAGPQKCLKFNATLELLRCVKWNCSVFCKASQTDDAAIMVNEREEYLSLGFTRRGHHSYNYLASKHAHYKADRRGFALQFLRHKQKRRPKAPFLHQMGDAC